MNGFKGDLLPLRPDSFLLDLLKILVVRLCGLLSSLSFVSAASLVLLLMGRTMSWYDQPVLLLPLYALPTVVINVMVASRLDEHFRRTKTSAHVAAVYADAAVVEFAIFVALGEASGLKSTYAVQLFVIFPSAALHLRRALSPEWQERYDAGKRELRVST